MSGTQALDHPAIRADLGSLRRLFERADDFPELRNPHPEPRVSDEVRAGAKPAAVLIPVVDYDAGPRLLVTRRHRGIRFAGHVCFPGGTRDEEDASFVDTALREAREEIGLDPAKVEVLGRLGDYYSQSGFRIVPVVGLVRPPLQVRPNPGEVDAIYEISLARMLASDSYRITWRHTGRGHIAYVEDGVRIAGPTVSLMIGLYESLLGLEGRP